MDVCFCDLPIFVWTLNKEVTKYHLFVLVDLRLVNALTSPFVYGTICWLLC